MKIFVTGAAGYIGSKLSMTLAREGHEVHALVRSAASSKWISHQNIKVFTGDLQDIGSLRRAMHGCEQVYHVAGRAGVWAEDKTVFYTVNVEGTRHVLDVAKEVGVKKIVYTSSCGVLGPSVNKPLEENDRRTVGFAIDYDRSKKMAEDLVTQYVKAGMHVIIVSPAKVFGPGHVSHSLMMNAMISSFLKKRITFVPSPGTFCVGFASVDDIVTGHILAMEKGRAGEVYILGGTNISHFEFFNRLRTLSSVRGRIVMLPKTIVKAWAYIQTLSYRFWGTPVMLTPVSVDHLFSHYIFSSDKAIRELGYSITPMDDVLRQTILYLRNENRQNGAS